MLGSFVIRFRRNCWLPHIAWTPPFKQPVSLTVFAAPGAVRNSCFLHKPSALGLIELFRCIIPVHNRPMIYGYVRVSTDGQSVDSQVRLLAEAGADRIFRETASGADGERAQLRRTLRQLEPGDLLMVTRLDRLARSTRDLLNTLAVISERRAGFRSLGDAWADTTTPHGRLMLTVLGGLAEFERELIRARTKDGRDRAKARGVKLGRRPKLTAHQRREALRRKGEGEPVREIARSYNVSHSTISRLAPETAASAAIPRRRQPTIRRTSYSEGKR
ncbi:recombinase family protein [Teichococcus aestuarii]|uniref:recombinase family protein n=1 Tax=Teichococcus aestuarii TaxID=568898 RepID=UPI001FE9BE71|nr:recombinase family protein [Pseudoroseomonas aestuarii]